MVALGAGGTALERRTMGHRGAAGRPAVERIGLLMVAIAFLLGGGMSQTLAQDAPGTGGAPTTVFVAESGHTVDGVFLELWREEQDLLGDPVTEEVRQAVEPVGASDGTGGPGEDRVVQYFDHAALVYVEDEDSDSPVELLPLGRMAAERRLARDPAWKPGSATDCGDLSERRCLAFSETGHTVRFGFKYFWDETEWVERLGAPVSESFPAGDGVRLQYFEYGALVWAPGEGIRPHALGAEIARTLLLPTEAIARPEEVPVFDEALFAPVPDPEPVIEVLPEPEPVVEDVVPVAPVIGVEGPGQQQGGYKEIVVSISAQTVWAYENGQLLQVSLVSTGTGEVPETVTPIGYHQILTKYDVQTMEGTISNEYYRVPDVPNVMYFDNLGNALHGAYWHNNFGAPMSHGCINLPLDVAAWMYAWAEIGTGVTVIA